MVAREIVTTTCTSAVGDARSRSIATAVPADTRVTVDRRPLTACATVWLMLLVASAGMAALFGVPSRAALSYAIYVALYVILPGIVLYGVASTTRNSAVVFAAKAAVAGQSLEMAVGLAANMAGMQALYPGLPLVYAAGLIYWRRRVVAMIAKSEDGWSIPALVSVVAAVFLVFAASLFNFDPVIDQHFTWVAAFAAPAVSKWPIPEPFLMDVPLHYHYLFNVHVGMAARTFHIPLVLVASRLAVVFHAFLFLLMLYAFCESRFKAGWLGAVAAVQMLLTFGYSALMWQDFHFATASIMYRVASTIVGFEVFLVLCDEILGHAGAEAKRPYALLVFMMLVAGGTRATMLPVLAAGLGLLWLVNLQHRNERRIYMALLGAAAAAFVAGAVFFLGFGRGASDGTRLLFFSPLNLAVTERAAGILAPTVDALLRAGVPQHVTALVYVVTVILGRTTFLLPGVLFSFIAAGSPIDRNMQALFGGVLLAGVALLVFVEAVVPQEIWGFYWYADIGLAVIGAAGMRAMWQRRATSPYWIRGAVLVGTLLLAAQLRDFAIGFVPKLQATSLPTPRPLLSADPAFGALLEALDRTIAPGDVLVTGGRVGAFDERVLPAAIPGLQLYASRYILRVYGARVKVDPRVASRLWLIGDDLSGPSARHAVRGDVSPERALYLLWIGEPPADASGLAAVGSWPAMSLWRVE